MSENFSVSLSTNSAANYVVTLVDTSDSLISVVSPSIRPSMTYHIDTPANTNVGVLDLVADINNTTKDTVLIVGSGTTNVSSNGSAIIISTDSIDGGYF